VKHGFYRLRRPVPIAVHQRTPTSTTANDFLFPDLQERHVDRG
jgi:hypothetical protein